MFLLFSRKKLNTFVKVKSIILFDNDIFLLLIQFLGSFKIMLMLTLIVKKEKKNIIDLDP